MKKVAIFLENKLPNVIASVGLELISETKRIVSDIDVEVVGIWLGESLTLEQQTRIQRAGANRVILVEHHDLYDYDTDFYANTLQKIAQSENFDILLLGSSLIGRDLGPRLSAKLRTGLTADATKLEIEIVEDKLTLFATRPALGGNIFATIICPRTIPQMATIHPGVFKVSEDYNAHLIVEKFAYESRPLRVNILKRIPKIHQAVDLTKAKLIVSGGRGVADKYYLIKELAALLQVEFASSRALVDAQIAPRAHLVGQTGTTVQPLIYLSFGISGAIQHLAGMDKSDKIIAINIDPNASIFEVADIGIVSDAKELLPLLIKRIKDIKGLEVKE
ncbi:MAG: electron transfer flavoprotein subunit alpha/FixB family protein [Acholeplasmatales bacterium]|jgi:electron transfer flavoprotein alpha subunit|nr:electron transfer flavoprotein subunit alpha/FixB family protein [Acholeplasmatales bacterium]